MFKWFSLSWISKSVFVPLQFGVAVFLVLAHVATFAFWVYSIGFFYVKYNDLLQLIATMQNQSDAFATIVNILNAMGVLRAFNDVFSLFSPFIISFLLYKVAILVWHSFETTSNEVFKIGVLVQQ